MYNRCKNPNNPCGNNVQINLKCNNQEHKDDEKCECGFENDPTVFPENYMYGQSYVPIQYIDKIFKPEIGLKMGTIFPELVCPYSPCQSMKEDAYLKKRTKNEGKCCKEKEWEG